MTKKEKQVLKDVYNALVDYTRRKNLPEHEVDTALNYAIKVIHQKAFL